MNIISGIGESGFLAHSAFSAGIATKDSNGNDITATYLTGVDLTPYQTIEGMTAYQEAGDYLTTADSGSFLTAVPDTYLQNTDLEISDNKITGISGIPLAAGGGGVTGDFTLVEGNGIQLTDDPIAQTTTISVSGDYATNTQLQNVSADITAMIPTALTGDYLDKASADTLYYPLNSNPNNYLTTAYTPDFAYHDSAISAIDESAIYDTSAHARINTLAGRINTLSSDKADVTALNNYQTTAGMTAYQPVGDYATTAQLADKVDSSAIGIKTGPVDTVTAISGTYISAWTANNASYATKAWSATRAKNDENDIPITSYLRTVPDTYLQNTDLATADGKVTAISGIPLSAGGDVPEGVMVESGLEYNAVNEISAYNGSAIAQYGAEKQWLVTDDTLLTLSNSAQFAIGVNISAVQQLMGIDETELLSSTATSAFTLTEPLTGFKAVKIKLRWWDKVPDNYYDVERFTTGKLSLSWTYFDNITDGGPLELAGASWTSNNGIDYNLEGGFARTFGITSTGMGHFTLTPWPLSIVGVGRIN